MSRKQLKMSKGWDIMSKLNEKLIDIYYTFKDYDNPPVPIETIKEYLKLEGISLEMNETKRRN